jgi:hypothetical protein
MNVDVPLTAERVLLAVEEAHDTLLAQMSAVLKSVAGDETLTIQNMAKRLGFDLTLHQDTLAAHRFFIEAAKKAFSYAGYTADPQKKRSRRRK